jgi:hypothetical protein
MKSLGEYLAAGVSLKPLADIFTIGAYSKASTDADQFNPWAKASAKDLNVNKQLLSEFSTLKSGMTPMDSNEAWFRRMGKEGKGQ